MSDPEILVRLDRIVFLLERIGVALGATRIKPPAQGRGVDPRELVTVIHTGREPAPEPREDELGVDNLPPASTRLPRAWTKGHDG